MKTNRIHLAILCHFFLGLCVTSGSSQSFTDAFSGNGLTPSNWITAPGGSKETSVTVENNHLVMTTNDKAYSHCWIKTKSNAYGFVTDGGSTGSLKFSVELESIVYNGPAAKKTRMGAVQAFLIGNDATPNQLSTQGPVYECPTVLAILFRETSTPRTYQVEIWGKIDSPKTYPTLLEILHENYPPQGTFGATITNSGGHSSPSSVIIFGPDKETQEFTLPAQYSPKFNSLNGRGVHLFLSANNGNAAGAAETVTIKSFSVSQEAGQ